MKTGFFELCRTLDARLTHRCRLGHCELETLKGTIGHEGRTSEFDFNREGDLWVDGEYEQDPVRLRLAERVIRMFLLMARDFESPSPWCGSFVATIVGGKITEIEMDPS